MNLSHRPPVHRGFIMVLALFLIVVSSAVADVVVVGPRVICEGTASIDLVAASGYRSYRWNTGAQTARLVVTQAGRYVVVTVDSVGVVDSGVVVVTQVQRPRPRIGNPFEYICAGDLAELRAPSGFVSYRWNTGQTSPSISIAQGGIYRVTVVDTNGCTGSSDAIQVVVTDRARPTIEGVNAVCLDAIAIYTAPFEPGVQYTWTSTGGTIISGQNTRTVRVQWQRSGRVDLMATRMRPDGVPCDTTVSLYVRVGSRLRPQLLYDRGNICDGDSIELRAASGFRTYQWSTGATGPSIVVRSAGTYFVDVEDSTGCQGTSDSVVVTLYQRPDVRIAGPSVICPGDRVILDATSAMSDVVVWQWSTGARTATIVVDTAGSYDVVGLTINGCADTARFTVRNAIPIAVSAPTTLRWDTTDVGVATARSILLVNNATTDVVVRSVVSAATIPTLTLSPSGGIRLSPGSTIDIVATWSAEFSGDVNATVQFILEQEGCIDTMTTMLSGHARVPVRLGTVDVWAIDTTVVAGSLIDIPLTVATGVSSPETTTIDVVVEWDPLVFRMTSVDGATMIDDVTTGTRRIITLRLADLALPRSTDTVVVMHGLAMLGGQLSTPINIRRIIVSGPSTYDVTAQDGSIAITGCWLAGRRITFPDLLQGAMVGRVYTLDGRLILKQVMDGATIHTVADLVRSLDPPINIGCIFMDDPKGSTFGPYLFLR